MQVKTVKCLKLFTLLKTGLGISHCVTNFQWCRFSLADLSHRRRVCSGVVQETADQPSTVVDVSPAVASAQPRRRFPPRRRGRLLPGTVASQPSLLPRSTGEKVDTDLQLRSLARLNGEAVTPTGSGSVYSLFSALMGGVVGVVVWFRKRLRRSSTAAAAAESMVACSAVVVTGETSGDRRFGEQ
nr:hypothetical protein Iba_chr10cCG13060 [Ipomoea batatas]